ncbi:MULTISPECIES: SMI1/KNR4 family protein [Listeria]|uniref:SMI1/KNR4 family protein n=1 Tax=Listeria TaxID=1637 RepID=UPI000B591D8F|nr:MULTISPECIES: SMI1/KNR4 family protein [Listeria]
MDNLKNKLDEIIDTEMKQNPKVWGMDCIEEIEKKYSLVFPTDYAFYLQYYGNDYIKDNYLFTLSDSLEKILNQNSFELDSIFGIDDDLNNLEKKILFYQDIIPSNLFPIADLPGGNLVCMDKENQQIYFWIHDEVEDTYLVARNFSEFIMQFQFEQKEQVNLDDIELNLSNDLDDLLKKAAEKYR